VGEVLSRLAAKRVRATARALGKRFVFTNGCFDVIHPGHVALLTEARNRGDFLLVGLNSDRSVRGLKGEGRPLQAERARATVLAALKPVDGVVVFDEETPLSLIRDLVPDVLVKGGDYAKGQVIGRDIVEGAGGEVVIVPLVPGHSSSGLAAKVHRP
jgi:D-beta-D-heptose 7-phosphate kinase/D-beta-D-heptose 1-phosphate adenosyltransferase